MRDWKKAFGQPDDGFTLRVQQTLLAIEEKEEEPVKKKMTLSLAFACVLFVTVLALSALAASNILGEKPDETLSPGENSIPEPTDAPTVEPDLMPMITTEPTPMPTLVPMVTPMLTPTPMLQPTPMPMEPASYWTTPYGNYYHLDEFCSGMEDAQRVSFEAAVNMGKQPCPICVEEYFRALEMDAMMEAERAAAATLPPESIPVEPHDSMTGEGIALMTDFNQPLRQGEAWGWGIDLTDPNNDDFHVGSEPLNSENNGVWTNDILTVHNIVFLKTRSAIFMEFEYSMNDDAIDPWSIRITPCMEGEAGPLGWHDARVHEVSGEDNTIRYLLSVITDSPADFPNITNLWVVYGGGTAEEQRLLGSLGNNLDWGRRYGR